MGTCVHLGICLGLALTAFSQTPITFQYIYDDLNQLTKVIDSTGIVIQYIYDPVGNITQIVRSTVIPGALTIFNITPLFAPAGSMVTIQGQGFSTVLSANTVLVNGVPVTVISATTTTLVIQLPVTATSGPVTVKVGTSTVTYGTNLTVLPTPVITAVSPKAALSGSTVASFQVTGLNLTASTFQLGGGITVTPPSINSSGTSATFSLTIGVSAFGRYTVLAINSIGSSSPVPVWGVNSLAVPGIASADPDGDGLANDYEILLGTDPLNPDTDGDGFSDGIEVASRSNPLDPTSTPLNSRLYGDAESLTFGISNAGFTSAAKGEADSKPFAVLETAATPLAPQEADSKPFSILDTLTTTTVPTEADSIPFSVLNNPVGTSLPNEADAILFSVCNTLLGPTSCSGYTGLSVPKITKLQPTGTTPALAASSQTSKTRRAQGPADGLPFSVLAVAPADQATRIAPTSPKTTVALAFSAPLDPASIVPGNFSLFAGDQALDPEIRYSADFRTVTLRAPLPPDASILVQVSDQVQDLWGRYLPAFQSEFHTGTAPRLASLAVVAQRPATGATAVDPNAAIHLSGAGPWPATLSITQNGDPVEGRLQATHAGKDIDFVPYAPFREGAVVRISLDGDARYEGLFTTADSLDIAEPLRAIAGGVIEIEYSRPLDRSTVTPATVSLTEDSASQPLAAGVMLRGDHIIRVMPSALLLPGSSYTVDASGVQDTFGQSAIRISQSFTAGSEVALGVPRLLSTTPTDAATDADANTEIHLVFDRPINPLTSGSDTVRLTQGDAPVATSISLAKGATELIITPMSPLNAAAGVQLTISGVEDLSGNTLPSSTVRFKVKPDSPFANTPFKENDPPMHRPIFAPRRVFEFLIGRR